MSIEFLRPVLSQTEPDAVTVAYDERYATTAADLWEAVTDPERLARWFAPVSGDLTPGGTVEIGFEDGSTPIRIRSCGERTYSFDWPQTWGSTRVTVRVLPDGGGARLQLTHEALTRADAAEYGSGWEAHLHGLAASFSGTDPGSWWQRYAVVRPVYTRRVALSRPGLVAARHLAAEPDEVFAAWTDAELIRAWYAPVDGWSVGEASVDARVGGGYRLTFGPDGTGFVEEGTYTVLDPGVRLAWDGTLTGATGLAETLHVEVDLVATETGTTVIVSQHDMGSEEAAATHEEGWLATLRHLAAFTETSSARA